MEKFCRIYYYNNIFLGINDKGIAASVCALSQ